MEVSRCYIDEYSQSYVDKKPRCFYFDCTERKSGSWTLFTKEVTVSLHVIYQGGNVWFFNVELLVILEVDDSTTKHGREKAKQHSTKCWMLGSGLAWYFWVSAWTDEF